MIYAIPSNEVNVANHFSRSSHITIMNEQHRILHQVSLLESDSICGKRKLWMALIDRYHINAVVVRHIGRNMLKHLFDENINVYSSPPKAAISELDLSGLTEVLDVDYGQEPRKKNGCCGKH